MGYYKIVIEVTNVGGVYNANDIEHAKQIAQSECDDVYARLNGRCTVVVESVEEVT